MGTSTCKKATHADHDTHTPPVPLSSRSSLTETSGACHREDQASQPHGGAAAGMSNGFREELAVRRGRGWGARGARRLRSRRLCTPGDVESHSKAEGDPRWFVPTPNADLRTMLMLLQPARVSKRPRAHNFEIFSRRSRPVRISSPLKDDIRHSCKNSIR